MKKFIQFHLLTSYPPSCLNRDDAGRVKTAIFGGATRIRISSQSLKRAWRTSDLFQKRFENHVGVRTRFMGVRAYDNLIAMGASEDLASETRKIIAGAFAKENDKAGREGESKQMVFFGAEEIAAIDEIVAQAAQSGLPPQPADVTAIVRKTTTGVDLAAFGRMLSGSDNALAGFSIDGAMSVANAITVHKAQVEDDFFTAVDDLQSRSEGDSGSGHMGDMSFGAGLFYVYGCLDTELLIKNLGGNVELAKAFAETILETMLTVGPQAKKNTFGSFAYSSFALVEAGSAQPRNLSVAFLKPVGGTDQLQHAKSSLIETAEKLDRAYSSDVERAVFDVDAGETTLGDLKAFVSKD